MLEKFKKTETTLMDFTISEVDTFLNQNSKKTFYAFAFDCNAERAEVNLCFNTEDDFKKTLELYQNGRHAEQYQSEASIRSIKWNTGDWSYQCFASINVFSEDELTKIFDSFPEDDYRSWKKFIEALMQLFSKILITFSETNTFKNISKTDNFKTFCIDHDESFEDAEKRTKKLKTANKNHN
jgi:hypothetical protein|tara:strand:+ start:432 stop:977 length:546 start_codon:yes stop_codon:yes gene_type:complete